jgi:hypothetical protein
MRKELSWMGIRPYKRVGWNFPPSHRVSTQGLHPLWRKRIQVIHLELSPGPQTQKSRPILILDLAASKTEKFLFFVNDSICDILL